MGKTIVYVGLDGERLTFDIPRNANRPLIARAVKNIHQGADIDLAVRALTEAKQGVLFDIVSTLEEHDPSTLDAAT